MTLVVASSGRPRQDRERAGPLQPSSLAARGSGYWRRETGRDDCTLLEASTSSPDAASGCGGSGTFSSSIFPGDLRTASTNLRMRRDHPGGGRCARGESYEEFGRLAERSHLLAERCFNQVSRRSPRAGRASLRRRRRLRLRRRFWRERSWRSWLQRRPVSARWRRDYVGRFPQREFGRVLRNAARSACLRLDPDVRLISDLI